MHRTFTVLTFYILNRAAMACFIVDLAIILLKTDFSLPKYLELKQLCNNLSTILSKKLSTTLIENRMTWWAWLRNVLLTKMVLQLALKQAITKFYKSKIKKPSKCLTWDSKHYEFNLSLTNTKQVVSHSCYATSKVCVLWKQYRSIQIWNTCTLSSHIPKYECLSKVLS